MDSPSPKRRRVNAAPPETTSLDSAANVDDVATESPRRSSYKAPTRASMAKHNPNLLSGGNDIATGDVQMESASATLRGPPRGLNPTALRPKMTAPRLSASPTRETSSSPLRRARASHSLGRSRPTSTTPAVQQTQRGEEAAAEDQIQAEEERSLIEEEKLAESVQRRAKRSRTGQRGLAPTIAKDQPEPELPPTPVHLGLEEKAIPPPGLLSSSPRSSNPARKAILKSSPLKPRAAPEGQTVDNEAELRDPAGPQMPQQAEPGTIGEEEAEEDDPEVLKRKERLGQYSKQLQTLRSEVSILQSQVLEYRTQPDQTMSRGNLNRLIDILTTSSTSERPESSPLKPTSLATRLSSFLPFAKRPRPVPKDPLLDEEIVPSYKPIEGSDPYQHLQAFTPFTVSSVQQLVPIEEDGALLNQQQLRLSAPNPIDLDIDLVLISDTDTDVIEQLSLESITPWANAELGTWIRQQAEETADMAVIGWGSSRYLDLTRTRAKCWSNCSTAFPQHISPMSTPPSSRSPSAAFGELDDQSLAPLLGNTSIRLYSQATRATLHVSWHIDLDWIGDVESRISATASLPSKWIERDSQRGSLSKIPETFQMLVKKVGVFEAIKVLVGLVLDVE